MNSIPQPSLTSMPQNGMLPPPPESHVDPALESETTSSQQTYYSPSIGHSSSTFASPNSNQPYYPSYPQYPPISQEEPSPYHAPPPRSMTPSSAPPGSQSTVPVSKTPSSNAPPTHDLYSRARLSQPLPSSAPKSSSPPADPNPAASESPRTPSTPLPSNAGPSASTSASASAPNRRPWSAAEEKALMDGLDKVRGPYWSQILALYGKHGTESEVLKDRTQVQLKDKARNLKMFFLKAGLEVPESLRGVTGELRTRAPGVVARRERDRGR